MIYLIKLLYIYIQIKIFDVMSIIFENQYNDLGVHEHVS